MTVVEALSSPRAFPVVIIALELGAAIRWACARNWGQATYWLLATGLVAVVTFGMGTK